MLDTSKVENLPLKQEKHPKQRLNLKNFYLS